MLHSRFGRLSTALADLMSSEFLPFMNCIYLVEGPVGAGKSTYAKSLSVQLSAPFICLDQWFKTLFTPDRPDSDVMPWYSERKNRCLSLISQAAFDIARAGGSVILELGLLKECDRVKFYQLVDEAGLNIELHVLDAPKEVRWNRVEHRNNEQGDTYAMTVTRDIFEFASSLWEPPTEIEVTERKVILIQANY